MTIDGSGEVTAARGPRVISLSSFTGFLAARFILPEARVHRAREGGDRCRSVTGRLAVDASKDAIEIEVICSDPSEHRRRVETRNPDIDGLSWPTWQAVLERTYEDWTRPHLVIDTAKKSIEEVTEELFNRLRKDCKLKV